MAHYKPMADLQARLAALTAEDFPAVAEELLTRTALVVNGYNQNGYNQNGYNSFRIAEVELYLDPDPYIHADPRQVATSGKWYFHRQAGKNYKGGTFKGVDITCAPPGTGGGILIRAVVKDDVFIEGPCNVVDALLTATGHASVRELAQSFSGGEEAPDAFGADSPLRLVSSDEVRSYIAAAPRVGLSAKYPAFRELPLRRLTEARRTRKDKGAILRALVREVGTARAAEIAGKTVRQMEIYAPPAEIYAPAITEVVIPDDDPIWAELGV